MQMQLFLTLGADVTTAPESQEKLIDLERGEKRGLGVN